MKWVATTTNAEDDAGSSDYRLFKTDSISNELESLLSYIFLDLERNGAGTLADRYGFYKQVFGK